MEKLLIVDDNEEIKKQLKWGLGKDYSVLLAKNADEAIDLFKKNRPKVVTLDLGLPPDEDGASEGLRCLEEILKERYETKVIMITGNDQRENALKAIDAGAYDFYQKPIDLKELKVIISRAFHLSALEEENRSLHRKLSGESGEAEGMFGQCRAMQEVFATIRKIASTDISVLIIGGSGTGKELVARAIHAKSTRKDRPFIAINCGAIPENLLESELFGYEKGAFTGANAQVQGKFEYAHQGSLFLDEIGELPASLQVKLLRFLQEKTIQRVGGREDIAVNARIIAATNIDINQAIEKGKFREDLYYRIGVITIKLPSLQERGGDIMALANLFLNRFTSEYRKKIKGFSPVASTIMQSYGWPGNVREMENKIQRAVLMSEFSLIEPRDLGFSGMQIRDKIDAPEPVTLKEVRDKVEREIILAALENHKGNILKVAEELDISRPTLYDLMKRHGIQKD